MKAKKFFVMIFTALAFVITFSGANSVSASKWHKGLPSFLVNTKWKSENVKLQYVQDMPKKTIDFNVMYTSSFNKYNGTGSYTTTVPDEPNQSSITKEKDKDYKYYKISKNVYKISYLTSYTNITNQRVSKNIYRINDNKIYWKQSEIENITSLSGDKIYFNKVN